jgi:hypothetical protein
MLNKPLLNTTVIVRSVLLVEKIFYIFLSLPILAVLIWVYFHPNDDKKWYEKSKYSNDVVKFITGTLIFIHTISISLMFDYYFIRMVLVLGFIIFVIYHSIKLLRN